MARGRGGRERERHIGSPSLVTGSARAKQKHVLRRGGEGKGSKQATRREGRRYTPRIPATGPPRLTTCTCMRSPGVAYRTHKIKNWKSRPTRTSSVHVFQLGGAACRWVVVSSFRVMMIGDNIFFLLIIAHFLSRLCTGWLAELAELAESPRTYTSRFPKIGSNFWTGPNGRAI